MRALLVMSCALALAACGQDTADHGGEDGENTRTAIGTPAPEVTADQPRGEGVSLPTAPGTGEGRRLIISSGCLACHRIGVDGQDGPGPSLNGVGTRLAEPQLRRALVSPSLPMPSYRALAKDDLDDLVAYLATLR